MDTRFVVKSVVGFRSAVSEKNFENTKSLRRTDDGQLVITIVQLCFPLRCTNKSEVAGELLKLF